MAKKGLYEASFREINGAEKIAEELRKLGYSVGVDVEKGNIDISWN